MNQSMVSAKCPKLNKLSLFSFKFNTEMKYQT